LLCEFEAALPAEVDVDQRHVGPQFLEALQCFGASGRHAYDRAALALQQATRSVDEIGAVIND
jgi:hypothetical protein